MKNMKVSTKLILSFLIVIALAILVGAVGIFGMSRINTADNNLYNNNLLAIDYLGRIRAEYNIQRAAIRDLALYNSADENFQLALSSIQNSEAAVDGLIASYRGTIGGNKEDEALFERFYTTYTVDFAAVKADLIMYGSANDQDVALEVLRIRGAAAQAIITPALTSCMELNEKNGKTAVDDNGALFTMMAIIAVVALILMVGVAIFFALHISSLIAKPAVFMKDILMRIGTKGDLNFTDDDYRITEQYAKARDEIGESVGMLLATVRRLVKIGGALEMVADGDLTADLALLSNEDTMGLSLQKMSGNLNNMFGEINQSTAQVSTGSKQIADGAQALAQGSTEQAAAVEQLSSSISEIAVKTKENADMAGKAANLAQSIMTSAEKGSRQMDEMMTAVKEINSASQSISKVISVIDNIAFQTNILALNAAVEAARAGQHGKGFAVVAEEVRSLASKSAEAAKDTGGLIANSMEKAQLGAKIAEETSASLKDIVSGINESSRIVAEIARSSEEQSLGISQINQGIDQVAQVIQQNSATAEESAAASEEMNGQAAMLEELVAQFKLKDGGSNPYTRLSAHAPRKSLATPARRV